VFLAPVVAMHRSLTIHPKIPVFVLGKLLVDGLLCGGLGGSAEGWRETSSARAHAMQEKDSPLRSLVRRLPMILMCIPFHSSIFILHC
jgi:hypothetical protein